ncbi:MAG: hypothetical protein M2R45_01059 [Verrucomicrobia subdivision 3 bacterium]|nr:hypothetical protein [Limisphaerales bacterium]MCS1414171.1 hypothetical protein [Limisphaerales bacterium]
MDALPSKEKLADALCLFAADTEGVSGESGALGMRRSVTSDGFIMAPERGLSEHEHC